MSVEYREVRPARQPIACRCGRWFEAKQKSDFTFACPHCHGYVGYCGPQGCDTGVEHEHWKSGDTPPTDPAPDYFDYSRFNRGPGQVQ